MKWHAQICLRWGPQGRDNSVGFDVDWIILVACRLGGSLAQVWKRMPKRSETRPSKTLKILFPCTREHSFHLRHATLKLWILNSFMASLGDPSLRFPLFLLRVFFWSGFRSVYCYSPDTRERFGEPIGEFLRGETPPGEGFEGTFS